MDNDYDIANEDGLDFPLGDDEVASCIDAVLAHEGVGSALHGLGLRRLRRAHPRGQRRVARR